MKIVLYLLLSMLSVGLWSCQTTKPFYSQTEKNWDSIHVPDESPDYTVYLLGNYNAEKNPEIMKYIREDSQTKDSSFAIVLYSKDEGPDAAKDLAKDSKGKVILIEDPQRVSKKNLDKKDDSPQEKGNVILPPACPGPSEIELTKDLLAMPVVPLLWYDDGKKKLKECDIKNEEELIDEVKDEVDNNQRKNILMLGYYPLLSAGNRGGNYSWRQHIFPLTDIHKSLFLPLPVLGSAYLGIRTGVGFKGDLNYPGYKSYRRKMLRAIRGYPNIVYAGSHENNLQYFYYYEQNFITANASGKKDWAGRHRAARFTAMESGVVKLTYLKNKEVWMEVIRFAKDNSSGQIIYRRMLRENVFETKGDTSLVKSSSEIADSTVYIAADTVLQAGKFKRFWLGDHYRDAWIAPVTVPVFDIRKEKGGLEIIKKGGGFQTKSLRLENKKGEEYTLRSVQKHPERLLGNYMVNTLAADIVKDQASSSHPYSPYVVDDLSEAAGVLHSHPKMVYIPNDSLLGEFKKEFGNTLALFEQRADGTMRPTKGFGYARETESSEKMLSQLHKDNGRAVDDFKFLKSRLFDMWIHDWDRHEGQWRWGEIECDSAHASECRKLKAVDKYYVPIPKDRDQAFARFDGVIPWIAGRKWAVRKFQDFQYDIRDVPGLNYNARNIDHALLTELSRQDWIRIADELQAELSDASIERAIKKFPDTIYKIDGPVIIDKLKARRDKLQEFAMEYYDYLAQYVDVVGSNEKEFFEVVRNNDDSTSVNVFDVTEGRKRLIYSRTFFTKETKEVRLYGLDGEDSFRVSGKTKKGILVRIIGGEGKDSIVDESNVKGWSKKTMVYDDRGENTVIMERESADRRSKDENVNEYDFYANNYNVFGPSTYFGYNVEDGIFLGGGIMMKYNKFRKAPYANYQRLVGNVAVRELSFNFKYVGDFNYVMGKWGINVLALVIAPKATTNFFGLGNETEKLPVTDAFYRLRYDEVNLFPGAKRHIGKHHSVKIGPWYEYVRIINTPGRFITSQEGETYQTNFTPHHFTGGKIEYEFLRVDDSVLTFRGIKWALAATSRYDLNESAKESTTLDGRVSVYIPIGNRSTLAMRAGAATVFGNYNFYHANTLGGQNIKKETGNLRGYLRDRFSGRTTGYLNTEVRTKLFGFRTYLFPAHFGLLAFYDQGRVWQDHESSTRWHNSFGGGIWIDPFTLAVINFTYAVSKEEKLFTIGIGFLF